LRLPGPDSPRLRQYLWLEYHADTSVYDYPDTSRHGIYAFVQVGKDNKKLVYNNASTSPGNYTFPLPASGRWDLTYARDSAVGKDYVRVDSSKPNPIVGQHLLMRPMLDTNGDGTLDKLFLPEVLLDDSGEILRNYPIFGGADDSFKPSTQTRLNASTNPSTNTLVTHSTPGQRNSNIDSDTSFITGLDIQIRDTTLTFDGLHQRCATVELKWNYFRVRNDVRWCGTLALKPVGNLNPKLTVDSGSVMLLDRSESPMQEKLNRTDTLNGKLYYSPLTTFTLYKGTQLVFKKGSSLVLSANSILYVRKGASLVFEPGSTLDAKSGSVVYVD
jgi:hypothetical protein